jgi:hypothetical protein
MQFKCCFRKSKQKFRFRKQIFKIKQLSLFLSALGKSNVCDSTLCFVRWLFFVLYITKILNLVQYLDFRLVQKMQVFTADTQRGQDASPASAP